MCYVRGGGKMLLNDSICLLFLRDDVVLVADCYSISVICGILHGNKIDEER